MTTTKGEAIAKILRGAWRAEPPPPDFEVNELAPVIPRMLDASVGGLAWWRIRRSTLRATPVSTPLREFYRSQAVLAARHTYHVSQVVARLQDAGIEPILFKGWAVARMYPEAGLRSSGDIDLAVRPDQLERAKRALVPLEPFPTYIDLHDGLGNVAHAAFVTGTSWDEIVARATTVTLGARSIKLLAPEEELQLLCLHMMRHRVGGPKWLCDVAVALETRPKNFDWARARGEMPYATWVDTALRLAHVLLGARLDDTPLAGSATQLPTWLVPEVLKRWETRPIPADYAPESLFRQWRQPSAMWQEFKARLPDPLEALILLDGSFDTPAVVYQGIFLVRTWLNFFIRFYKPFPPRPSSPMEAATDPKGSAL